MIDPPRLGENAPAAAPSRELVRQRIAVTVAFVISGAVAGSWFSRIPAIKGQVHVTDAGWGAITLGTAAGSLAAMVLARRFLPRVGARRVVLISAPLQTVVPVGAALARTPAALAATLLVWGLSTGALQAAMNSQAVRVERRYGRIMIPAFHASWSGGALVGALSGAASAALRLEPATQLAIIAVALLGGGAAVAHWLPPDTLVTGKPEHSRFTPQIMLLASVSFCGSLSEGAAAQWSAVYAHDSLRVSASIGAAAFATFYLSVTVGRSFGNRAVGHLGRVRALTVSGLVASAGFAAGLALHTVTGLIIGLLLFGLGLSCVIPTVTSLAGSQPGISAPAAVTAIGIVAWPAGVVGPPAVGFLSDATDLRIALLLVCVVTASIALLSRRVRDERIHETASTTPADATLAPTRDDR